MLNCCPDCPSSSTHFYSFGWIHWAGWAAVKQYITLFYRSKQKKLTKQSFSSKVSSRFNLHYEVYNPLLEQPAVGWAMVVIHSCAVGICSTQLAAVTMWYNCRTFRYNIISLVVHNSVLLRVINDRRGICYHNTNAGNNNLFQYNTDRHFRHTLIYKSILWTSLRFIRTYWF